MTRVSGAGGSTRTGNFGLPVAGGHDVDGDGFADHAVAYMTTSRPDAFFAGEVLLVFGNGTIGESIDSAVRQPRVLHIVGDAAFETTGSEIWMDDVTGDGLGDLLVARQNFTPEADRVGAGALTIIVGGPGLRTLANSMEELDLRNPPSDITLVHLVGPQRLARLGIWARTGDVDGDGIADIVVGADQESTPQERSRGAAYVIRGGSHINGSTTIDLANFGATSLAGSIARITPPLGSENFHFGATCQIGDLNDNGRGEVIVAATLARAGAAIEAEGTFGTGRGGPPHGKVFIIWDDSFPLTSWPAGYHVDLDRPMESLTVMTGGKNNSTFGEELLAGPDYDGDDNADLFVGDLTGDGTTTGNRALSGVGYVFYDARRLRGRTLQVDALPSDLRVTSILGPREGALGSDTAAVGDIDADGIDDLVIGSPHASPQGRDSAGAMHVLFGREGGWPRMIDTEPTALYASPDLLVTEVQGVHGTVSLSQDRVSIGDTLCYSAAAGDLDGDGRTDIIANEMMGDGVAPDAINVGNVIVLSGKLLAPESDTDDDEQSSDENETSNNARTDFAEM